MERDVPDRPPANNLVEALDVRRNAAVGFAVGVAVAVLLYAFRVGVVGSVRGQAGGPLTFLALGVVLALTLGALVTAVLVALSARRLAREVD
ncbi:DUF7536 family protein [Halomicrococcus sp. NG-SE-24]|uniref:DUF7536 family protein n=1 Tax=unclassified Halomicrococcus TaxID=2614448 RepID=UPI000DDF2CA6|nr:hypothetical protein DMJ13_00135 [halophilic archaeon]